MDQNAFLKATQHASGEKESYAPAPVIPSPAPKVAPPPEPVQVLATPSKSQRLIKRLRIPVAVIFFAALFGGGGWYYYTHHAYSDEQILKAIRSSILPSVVQIYCATEEGGQEAIGGTGVYFVSADGKPFVETNAHVILGPDWKYHGCNVYFPRPEDGSFYDSIYVAGEPILYHNVRATLSGQTVEGIDYALLPLSGPGKDTDGSAFPFPPKKPDIYVSLGKLCRDKNSSAGIGDKVYELGYPDVGGESITLTEGIVSGFTGAFDEWIKVSAGTSHGNSGGIAIGARNGCTYGIPSRATFQEGGNLGFLLSPGFIRSFVAHTTGESTYDPAAKDYATSDYTFKDFSLKYPSLWTVATSSDQFGVQWITFSAPFDNALDSLSESVTIGYYDNATEDVRTEAISSAASSAKSIDDNAIAEYVRVKNKDTFSTYFIDNSLSSRPVPTINNQFIFPLLRGTLYVFLSTVQNGPLTDAYTSIVTNMVNSIHFK